MKRSACALASLLVAVGINLVVGGAVAAAATGTFGNTVPGASIDTPGADFKFGSIYPLATNVTATDFR